MFNPKERLEQIRKNKHQKEQIHHYITETPSPQLFPSNTSNHESQDLNSRISKLQNIVNQLSHQLESSQTLVTSLTKQNNQLQNKLLKLQYENSQLKTVSIKTNEKQLQKQSRKQVSQLNQSQKSSGSKEQKQVRKSESNITENEVLMVEVQQALEQIKKEPIENILKRKEHNFRALKTDPRQTNSGNKVLKQFAAICKDYHKTLKKPLLVLKLQASDFE